MALNHRVAAVLYEPAVDKIDFQMGGFSVGPRPLKRIAKKIRRHEIHVYVYRRLTRPAEYVRRRHSILLQNDSVLETVYGKSAVVRESVLAMTDAHGWTAIARHSGVMAALLAQTIYALASGDTTLFSESQEGDLSNKLARLIDEHGMLDKAVNLDEALFRDIRDTIRAHPDYRSGVGKRRFPLGEASQERDLKESFGCSLESRASVRGKAVTGDVVRRGVAVGRETTLGADP